MAIISVDNHTAADFLKRDVHRYLAELTALELNMPPFPRRVFADADKPSVLMLVQEYPDGVWVTVSGYNEKFLLECFDWWCSSFDKFILASVDERVFDVPEMKHIFELGRIRRSRSFLCTSIDRVPAVVAAAGRRTEFDKEAFERYPQEPARHRPGLSQLFQLFVLEGHGEIFAVKEKGEILAYLSCASEYENVWDVDFIHVREDRRRQGLGAQLAALYARGRLKQSQIPYYSGARSETSQRTALKAGFLCCRELVFAEVKPIFNKENLQ